MNKVIRFIFLLGLAFFIDICCMILFKRPIVFFVGMLFVEGIVQEKQNWRVIASIVLLYLLQSFIVMGHFGFPLFYLLPLAYLAQKARKLMHFSCIFHICFLFLLIFFQNMSASFFAGSWHVFDSSMIKIICVNIALFSGVLWRYNMYD